MIKGTLNDIIKIYINLNQSLDGKLISMEDLIDIQNDINNSFDLDYAKLLNGINQMKEMNFSKLNSPNDDTYLEGMFNIYTSLNRLENYFIDLREAHIQISKAFRYIAGEITLEEYQASDEIILEDERENEEETFGF